MTFVIPPEITSVDFQMNLTYSKKEFRTTRYVDISANSFLFDGQRDSILSIVTGFTSLEDNLTSLNVLYIMNITSYENKIWYNNSYDSCS